MKTDILDRMNGLTDSLTIGIMITLVFGAVCFYLYSRLVQNEKRVALVENILLDLKMSMEQGGGFMDSHQEEGPAINHIEPVSGPMPLEKDDIEQTDEDFYKNILQQAPAQVQAGTPIDQSEPKAPPSSPVASSKVQPNYESMTVKELKALAKQRGLSVPTGAGRKELMDTLRKNDKSQDTEVEGGSSLGKVEGYSLDAETLDG